MSQNETAAAASEQLAARSAHWTTVGAGMAAHEASAVIARANRLAHPNCPICAGCGTAFGKLCDCTSPAAGGDRFALARRFIAALPPCADDPDLAQAVDHLRDALAFIDALQRQEPAAYLSPAKLDRLKDRRDLGLGATLHGKSGFGTVGVYTHPSALLATVRTYVDRHLQDERDSADFCASDAHHADTVALFAAIERAEKGALA